MGKSFVQCSFLYCKLPLLTVNMARFFKRERMNDLIAGIHLQLTNISPQEFVERLSEAWLQFRYCSPLIAAGIIHTGPLATDLGSWMYTPVNPTSNGNENDVLKWREQTLHVHTFDSKLGQALNPDTVNDFMQKHLSTSLPYGQTDTSKIDIPLLHGHLLVGMNGTTSTNEAVFLLHGSHTLLDGPCEYLAIQTTSIRT